MYFRHIFIVLPLAFLTFGCSTIQQKQGSVAKNTTSQITAGQVKPVADGVVTEQDNSDIIRIFVTPEDAAKRKSHKQARKSKTDVSNLDRSIIWSDILDNLSIEYDEEHPRVVRERKRYVKKPSYLGTVTQRAEPFMFHIVEVLKKEGLPTDLVALPIVESAFLPRAKSHHGAAGLWQFIASTGDMYGLQRNWWYDGRLDTIKATKAAAKYLKKLNELFDGDWLLTLAAYNAGEYTVIKAIKANLDKGEPTDYWHLDLPSETLKYVPRFLAVLSVIENPEYYGVKLWPIKNQPFFKPVKVGGKVSLKKLSQSINVDESVLKQLNAGLRRGVTPPQSKFQVMVPAEVSGKVAQLDPGKLRVKIAVSKARHKVRSGETLSQISRKYGVPIIKIKAKNSIKGDHIRVGQTLRIPGS